MRMQAVLLPPRDVQDDLATAVAAVPGTREQLDTVEAHLLHLRLANFGKVSHADAEAVRTTLRKEFLHWDPMTFHFGAGVALEPIGDDSVWAKLEGDVEQLIAVANLTVRVVKRLGFLVDRRLPRSLVRVGRITPATSEDYLQRLIDRLERHRGPDWTGRDLALVRTSDAFSGPIPTFEVLERLSLKAG